MKYVVPLICLSLIAIATPALALQGSECLESSKRLNPAERGNFVKACLAKAQDPSNVQEKERKHKLAVCEQNARNKKLQGNEKAAYHDNCMNKNEAAAVAKSQPQAGVVPNRKAVSSNKPHGTTHKLADKKQPTGKKQKLHKKNEKPVAKVPETSAAK